MPLPIPDSVHRVGGPLPDDAFQAVAVGEVLAEIWRRVLRAESVEGRFFDSGGDGLAAAEMLSLIDDALGIKVPMASFVAGPTLAALTAVVCDQVPAENSIPEGAVAPVAFSQEGMLWHEHFSPGSFNLPPFVRRYRGRLDIDSLRQALSDIVERHAPLRATFTVAGGRPQQRIGSVQALPLPITDLGDLEAADQRREVGRAVTDAAVRPFNLEDGPLFEPHLFRLAEEDHVLMIRLHHLVFDDWSVNVFRRELSARYRADAAGTVAELPDLVVEFPDVCRARRRALAGRAGSDELAWWRRELHGAPFTVGLPIGDPGRPVGSSHPPAVTLELPLPSPVVDRFRQLAREERTTLFMTMLSVFAALVHQLSGQEDLVMASVVANRGTTAVEPLIGCFTKKILLRIRLAGDPTFRDVMRRARATVLGALAHQELSYETVLQEVLGDAAAAHGLVPDVSLMFQAEVQHKDRLSLPGLTVSAFDTGVSVQQPHFAAGDGTTGSDALWGAGLYRNTFLILSLKEADDGVSLLARGAFHPPAVEAVLGRFAELAAEIITDPGRQLSDLPNPRPESTSIHGAWPDELRGFLIEPDRIAAALSRHPSVLDAAVVLQGDTPDERQLVAYIVPDPKARISTTLSVLRTWLWSELPGYAWPSSLALLPALPRSDDGGLDAAVLRSAATSTEAAPVEPTANDEPSLASLWADVLGAGPVDIDANYWQRFSFVEVVGRAAGAGVPISGEQVRRNRTLRTLSTDLAASRLAAAPEALPDAPPSAPAVPAVSDHVVRTEALTKTYPGGRVAVQSLDLSLVAGEILGVLGPNGAGKTTTVGMLTGKVIPTSGRAFVKGIDVVAHPAAAKHHMGLVQQGNTLDRGLNVWENLYFHARYFGMSSKQAQAATVEVLDRLHLVGRERAEVHTLSGGFVRRVMLARAILHRPAILFLDEPTAGLDPQTRLALWEILEELRAAGQTIFMTTHYMEEADRLSDRVAIMDHGRILALDTPAGLKRSLGHGASLTGKAEGDLARLGARLESIDGSSDVQRDEEGFRLRLASAENALIKVISAAQEASCKLTDLSVLEDTLENVFINLTGRDLRE